MDDRREGEAAEKAAQAEQRAIVRAKSSFTREHAIELQERARRAITSSQGLTVALEAIEELEHLRVALEHRGSIELAKGLLMATLDCDEETAFAHLVAASQRSSRKLYAVAATLVAEHERRVRELRQDGGARSGSSPALAPDYSRHVGSPSHS